jgi:hypothetical protein
MSRVLRAIRYVNRQSVFVSRDLHRVSHTAKYIFGILQDEIMAR